MVKQWWAATVAGLLVACGSADPSSLTTPAGPDGEGGARGSAGGAITGGAGGTRFSTGGAAPGAGGLLVAGGRSGAGGSSIGGAGNAVGNGGSFAGNGGTVIGGGGLFNGNGGRLAAGGAGPACLPFLQKQCGSACVSIGPDVGCGSTGCTPCSAVAHAKAICSGARCDFTCEQGFVRSGSACVAAPTCTDKVQNQSETDVDCGGNTSCPRCPSGDTCYDGTDCKSGRCGAARTCVEDPNILRNPGFEANLDGWTSNGASVVTTDGVARSGAAAIALGGDGSSGSDSYVSQVVPSKPGTPYTFSGWGTLAVTDPTATAFAVLSVRCYSQPDGKGSQLTEVTALIPDGDTYQQVDKSFTTPDGTASLEFIVTNPASNGLFYADDLSLTSP